MPRAPAIAIAVIALMSALTQVRPIAESDLWWHLWGGRQVLAQGTWFIEDHSSYLQDGQIWQNTEWGFQVLVHGLWRLGGPNAILGLVAAVAAAGVLATGALAMRLAPARPWAAVGATGLVAGALLFGYTPRPQIFNLSLVPLALLVLEVSAGRRRLILLSVLGLFWAHTHASHVLLPALALGKAIDEARGGRPWREGAALVAALGGVSLLLGPLGPGVVAEILDHAGTEAARMIDDMRAPTFAEWFPSRLDPLVPTLLLMGFAAGRAALGASARLCDLSWAALGLALGLTAVRFQPLAAALALPLALRGLVGPEPVLPRLITAAVGLAIVPAIAIPAARALPERAPGGGLWTASLPVHAADLLAEHAQGARLYNAFGDGGYLAWALAPGVQITIDGRTPTFFDPRHLAITTQTSVSGNTLLALLDAHRVDWALVPRDRVACARLREAPGWRVVSVDRDRLLLTRGAALPGIDLEILGTCLGEPREDARCAEPGFTAAALDELRALEGLGGWDYAALARIRLVGCPDAPAPEALASDVDRALSLAPDAQDRQKIALLLSHLGQPDRALAALAAGLPDPGTDAIRAQVLASAGRLDEAAKAWDAAARAMGPNLPVAARVEYATLLAVAGRVPEAAEQARRAAWAGDARAAALLAHLMERLTEAERQALAPYLPPEATLATP